MASSRSKVGFLGGLAIAIGSSIGGGLWATPVIASSMAGPIAVLLALLVAVPTALALPVYLTLAKAWPKTVGVYYYTTRMLIPEQKELSKTIGFSMTFSGVVLGGLISLRYMLLGGAAFLHAIVPAVSTGVFVTLLMTISFAVVWFGIRSTGLAEIVLSTIMLLAIGVIVVGGVLNIDVGNLTPVMSNGFLGVLPAYAVLITLGAGGVKIINFGEEIEDVENTIGDIIITSAALDIFIAVVVTLIAVGVVSYTQLAGQTLEFVVNQYLSGGLVIVTGIGALVAGLTTNIASLAIFSRISLVLVDDNIFPKWMGKENKHGESIFMLLILYILSVSFTFVDISFGALAASYAFLFIAPFLAMSVIGFRLPSTFPDIFEVESVAQSRFLRPSVVRWSSLSLFAILFVVAVFLVLTQPKAFAMYLVLLAVGVTVYAVRWWQVGDSTRLLSSGVGFRPAQNDGGERPTRSD